MITSLASISPTVWAALIAAIVALITVVANIRGNHSIERTKARNATDLEGRRQAADIQLADRRFRYERRMVTLKRMMELAETVLEAAYEAKSVLEYATGHLTRAGEGESRPGRDVDQPTVRSSRDSVFVVIERIRNNHKSFDRLVASTNQFAAYFGSEGAAAIDQIIRVKFELEVTASILIETMGVTDYASTRETIKQFRSQIYGKEGEGSLTQPRLREAVATIERLCKPVLVPEDPS